MSDRSSAVQRTVRSVLAEEPIGVLEVATLGESNVWDVRLPSGRVVFKGHPWQNFIQVEEWGLRRLEAIGVPAPRVHAADVTCDLHPTPYLIADWIDGAPVSANPAASQDALASLGRSLRVIHDERVDGYGLLDGPDHRTPGVGAATSWSRALEEYLAWGAEGLVRLGRIPESVARRLRTLFESRRRILDMSQPQLLHGDLQADHVLIGRGGQLAGVIDPWPYGGHPGFDLARISITGGSDVILPVLTGYEPDDSVLDQLDFYELVTTVAIAHWRAERSGDPGIWLERLTERTSTI